MKKSALFPILLCFGTLFSCNLCMAQTEASSHTQGIIYGQNIFIQDDVIMIPYENHLITGLLDEKGDVYDLIQELSLDQNIYTVAQDGQYLYLGTTSQLNRVDIAQKDQGTQVSQLICDDGADDGFQIYDGFIYYPYGSSVYRVSKDGGEEDLVVENVEDYELTTDGIYYLTSQGRFCFSSLDGTLTQTLGDSFSDGKMTILGSRMYITTDQIFVYDLDTQTLEQLPVSHSVNEYDDIVPMNDYLLFTDDDFSTYKYEFSTGLETEIHSTSLPDKESRVIKNNQMYYSYATGKLFILNMADYQQNILELDALTGQNTGNSGNTQVEPSTMETGSFNITDGLYANASAGGAFMGTDYFCLYFNTEAYLNGEWAWEVIDDSAIRFYYPQAAESGYGGHIMTIRAYDWGDNSYSELPSYQIAGLSSDKKHVAIFPTDVQYDSNDSIQCSEYPALLEYAKRVDQDNPDNPFSVTSMPDNVP